jgi:hypothetical protein
MTERTKKHAHPNNPAQIVLDEARIFNLWRHESRFSLVPTVSVGTERRRSAQRSHAEPDCPASQDSVYERDSKSGTVRQAWELEKRIE